MNRLKKWLVRLLALISLTGLLNYIEITSANRILLWIPKTLVAALSSRLAMLGVITFFIGRRTAPLASRLALTGAAASLYHLWRATRPAADAFATVFGADWQQRIREDQRERMLSHRWTWLLPDDPEPRLSKDVVFWRVPGTDRDLLCDIREPPQGVTPSGIVFIYFHGSGWMFLDKDAGTRTLFQHLTAQGHVCMDVAYRLVPETDLHGMVGDCKRAVAWMKLHAADYGASPDRIVLAGGSAGGHLALLTGYTPNHSELDPEDVRDIDTTVHAIVSYYGVPDLKHFHDYGREHIYIDLDSIMMNLLLPMMAGIMPDSDNSVRPVNMSDMPVGLLGGTPDDSPDRYRLGSPVSHVSATCPQTLFLQGGHDIGVRADVVRQFHRDLVAAGVDSVYIEYPYTDHAFDLMMPRISPAAQASLYDLERYLALIQ